MPINGHVIHSVFIQVLFLCSLSFLSLILTLFVSLPLCRMVNTVSVGTTDHMLVASLSQCSTDLLASSAASAHVHTVMSVHVCTGSTRAVFSLCCWHCWWASGSIWSVQFGFVICRLNAISNVFSTSLNLLSSSTPKKRDGYSQPRQPAWTNRYLSKVHWWIYSVLLTTEISNNLSEMPNPMLDISCALTPHLLFSYSWCQLQPPPHLTPQSLCRLIRQ